MKRILIGLLVVGAMALYPSCQKDGLLTDAADLLTTLAAGTDDGTAVAVNDLPADIVTFVETKYAPLEISDAWMIADKGYTVVLEDGTEVYFDIHGKFVGDSDKDGWHDGDHEAHTSKCIEGDTVTTADLPQAAIDYVAANYPNASIATVVIKPNGHFGVELSDGTVLLFDTEGAFIKECGCDGQGGPHGGGPGGHHGGGHHGGGPHGGGPAGPQGGACIHGDTISLDSLPAAIFDYVSANYGDTVTISVAVRKPHGFYAVALSNEEVLIFKDDGTFVKECDGHEGGHHHGGTLITPDQLPQAALDYIAANYPDATIEKAVQTYHGKYFVELSGDIKIVFDEDGNVLYDSGN